MNAHQRRKLRRRGVKFGSGSQNELVRLIFFMTHQHIIQVLKDKSEGKDVFTPIWHPVKKWVQCEMEKADGIRETGAERVSRILGIPEIWL